MPLRHLFVDMNSYFASAEQQERPELRGKPVGVVPTLVDTSCCIAASYEAKKFGIRTGTLVRDARRLCPDIRLVEARPSLYVYMHRRIVEAVETCLPVNAIMSIDEMDCTLLGRQQEPANAVHLAQQIKKRIIEDVGKCLRCSIGLAPNTLLAKMASDMQKPDGLTVISSEELPRRLYPLQLIDFPGIGPRMQHRFQRAGITTVEQLCQLSRSALKVIWGSEVLADRWWRRLRGEDIPDPPTHRSTVSHSRVLSPEHRNLIDARAIAVCLLHKAAMRLRNLGYWACSLGISVSYLRNGSWHNESRMPLSRDTLSLLRVFSKLWDAVPDGAPLKVGVVLANLIDGRNVSAPLFEEEHKLSKLADAMDQLNRWYGRHAVYFGSMHGAQGQAPTRIGFTNVPDDV